MESKIGILFMIIGYFLQVKEFACGMGNSEKFGIRENEEINLDLSLCTGTIGRKHPREEKLYPVRQFKADSDKEKTIDDPLILFPLSPVTVENINHGKFSKIENEKTYQQQQLHLFHEDTPWPLNNKKVNKQSLVFLQHTSPSMTILNNSQVKKSTYVHTSNPLNSNTKLPQFTSEGEEKLTTERDKDKYSLTNPTSLCQELCEHYSCQILSWYPLEINQAAALVSYSMAPRFLEDAPGSLHQMHQSHSILIPFIYKLVVKKLTGIHWKNIIAVWKEFWNVKSNIESTFDVLKKFIWLSDLISEATLPEIYQETNLVRNKNNRIMYGYYLRDPKIKIIRRLSDGRTSIDFHAKNQKEVISKLNNQFEKTMFEQGDQYLLESQKLAHIHNKALQELEEKSKLIYFTISKFNVHPMKKRNPLLEACQENCFSPGFLSQADLEKLNDYEVNILMKVNQKAFGPNFNPKSFFNLSPHLRLDSLKYLNDHDEYYSEGIISLPKSIHNYFHKIYPGIINQRKLILIDK
ncbi:hypothetical protein PGTUg99_013781 [Puccinia graminis f. sp. tritici]|uniref:Uncharacterized protein n=1 Tax=Puccinia graminis f. sp. tritici TaxID=56615 RepID=A0A5B0NXH4_PUCGR|nr:hypothetical protein PGTUg99_013781 [Puccinia graminis f. sp. tritici]